MKALMPASMQAFAFLEIYGAKSVEPTLIPLYTPLPALLAQITTDDKGLHIAVRGSGQKSVETRLVVGRHRACDLVLDHLSVSRRHAYFYFATDTVTSAHPSTHSSAHSSAHSAENALVSPLKIITLLEDAGSAGGIYLNGDRMPRLTILHDGDKITIGQVTLYYYQPQTDEQLQRLLEKTALAAQQTTPVMMAARASLEIIQSPVADLVGKKFSLRGVMELIIGRWSEADVPIADNRISRRHARLYSDGTRFWIEDLQSSNGTYLGGVRINETVPLLDGQQIRLGGTIFTYRAPTPMPDFLQ